MNYRQEDFKPVLLEQDAQDWIIRHFKHTKNAEIGERFGISQEWLHRFARKHGLKKSPQFLKKCHAATAAAAKASHLRNGTYPPKGFKIPNSEANWFKPGYKQSASSIRKRTAKSAESRRRTVERERLRIALGEPQKTKLNLKPACPRKNQLRYYLRKIGYIIDRGSSVAYYDENTRRSLDIENRKKGDKGYVYFEFKPLDK